MTFKIRWPNNAFEKFGMIHMVTVIYVLAKYIKIVPLMFLSQSEFNFPLMMTFFFFLYFYYYSKGLFSLTVVGLSFTNKRIIYPMFTS